MSWGMKAVLSAGAACVMLVTAGWGAGLLTAQEKGKQEEPKSVVVTPAVAPEHSDYQALQGTWRWETRHEVTGELLRAEEMTIKGSKYAKAAYEIKNGTLGLRGPTSDAFDLVLSPNVDPKRLELMQFQIAQVPNFEDETLKKAIHWDAYHYEIRGDILTLHYLGGYPLMRNKTGEIATDRSKLVNVPTQKFTIVCNRVKPAQPNVPLSENRSEEEKKLLDQLIKERTEVLKLREDAYRVGKEPITSTINSIERLLEARLDRDAGDAQKQQVALQEAFDKIKRVEGITEAKYKSGSSTQLDLSTAREARINIELKLLRHKKQLRGGL